MRKIRMVLASAALAVPVLAGLASAAQAGTTYTPQGISGATPVSTQLSNLSATTAADPTGVCWNGSNPALCWRQDTSSHATDIWPRDIAGDTHQQYDVTYWGQAPGADNGACSQFSGVGVFTFVSPADGYRFVGAGFFSGGVYYVGGQLANNRYSNWVWFSNGVLENCGDSVNGARFALQSTGAQYSQLYTSTSTRAPTWVQVHV